MSSGEAILRVRYERNIGHTSWPLRVEGVIDVLLRNPSWKASYQPVYLRLGRSSRTFWEADRLLYSV